MKRSARKLLSRASVCSALAILALLLTSAPVMAYGAVCATTTIDEPFVLPGGLEHDAGKLTLCRSRASSPSRATYVGYVDRAAVGMLFSQRGWSEAPTETEPYMMFARDRAGRLHLYGLAIPCRKGVETFLFENPSVRGTRNPSVTETVTLHSRSDRPA